MKPYFLLFSFLLLLGISPLQAQQKFILTGSVRGSDSAVLSGAHLVLKHSRTSALSDANGFFHIESRYATDTLRIEYIGYAVQTIAVNAANTQPIFVRLTGKEQSLQEVIVQTGYQSIAKDKTTGSYSVIDNKLYNQQVGTSVLARLEGVANGLTIDKKRASSFSTGIMIRGLSTIGGPKDPLIVLDNFPYDGDLNNINPNEVESITLLKDAAAAAIWGTRAGNGVIVITTKKGHYNQPMTVEFSSNMTLTSKPDLGYTKPISASDYIDVEQMLYGKGFYNSAIGSVTKPALSPVVELLIQKANGQISPADADAQINALRNIDVRNDFSKYIYDNALLQQYALSVRGGSQNNAWMLSGGYDHNRSELDASLQRISLRGENTIRLGSRFRLTTGLSYIQNNTLSGQSGYGSIGSGNSNSIYPYAMLADANGQPLPVNKSYRRSYLDTLGQGKLLDWKYYPLDDYTHARTSNDRYDLMAYAGLNYTITPELSAELQYRYENQRSTSQTLYDRESFFARNIINNFTQLNYASGQRTYKVPVGGILDQTAALLEAKNYRLQLNYNKSWKQHRITALAGSEVREINTSTNTYRIYGFNPDNLSSGNVDYTTTYPSIITGFSSFIPNNNFLSKLFNHYLSTYANMVYSYQEKYSFSASARRDASNIFGVNTNQKWTPLWSAGVSWMASKEKFYPLDFLPYLKLSMSYGYSGNVDPGQAALTTLLYQSASPYTLTPIAAINQYGNPDLRWEKAGQFNLRMEFRTTRDRLTGSVEYYSKTGKDLYGLSPVDYTGVSTSALVKNSASMKGSGWDIELNSLNVDRKIKWQTSLLWNIARNTVTAYYTNTARASAYITGSGVYGLNPLQGYPVYSVFSYPFAGLDPQTGNPQGILSHQLSTNYTALISDSLQNAVYNGSAVPISQVALRNTFSLGRFSLAVNLLGKFGFYFRRSTIDYTDLFNNGNGHADFARRWQNPGDELSTNIPSMVYPLVANRDVFFRGSEAMVEKGDHIRLQYITLSYEYVPMKKAGSLVKRARLFLNASNLGIVWRANRSGLDPDYLDNTIPPAASFALGCNLSF